MRNITAAEALHNISNGLPIENCVINEKLDITRLGRQLKHGLIIKNSTIQFLYSPSLEYLEKVLISNSRFAGCVFNYAYFIQGIRIEGSVFESYLDFEAGVHNEKGDFVLEGNSFKRFVNFFDCWFKGNVIINGNVFQQGTNISGNRGEPYEARFDGTLLLEENVGQLDSNGEGDRNDNIIHHQNKKRT